MTDLPASAKALTALRKRPQQERSSATFAVILDSAAHILKESGGAKLTTNRIAARAGVSIGSLYQYFPNKQEIVRALMVRELAAAQARRPASLDDLDVPLADRVRALVDWRCDVTLRDMALSQALISTARQVLSPGETERFVAARRERAGDTLVSWLSTQGQREVETAAFVTDTILSALIDGARGANAERLRGPTLRAEIATLLTRYLEKPPGLT